MSLDELVAAVRPFIDPALPVHADRLPSAVDATRTHLSTFADINEQLASFFPAEHGGGPPAAAAPVLAAARERLRAADWTEDALTTAVRAAGRDAHVSGRALYEPLRLALTGRAHGPPLAAILLVQGRERALDALGRFTHSGGGAGGGEGN
jgi:glutamyl-tRNA synthetase